MSYRIISIPHFDKEFKRLAKRYHSLKNDLAILVKELADDPQMGMMISKGC